MRRRFDPKYARKTVLPGGVNLTVELEELTSPCAQSNHEFQAHAEKSRPAAGRCLRPRMSQFGILHDALHDAYILRRKLHLKF